MKVDIIRDENGKAIGWNMTGETPEEIKKVGIIRDLQFWGFEETGIVYAGREDGDDKAGNPGTLKWKQRIHAYPEDHPGRTTYIDN